MSLASYIKEKRGNYSKSGTYFWNGIELIVKDKLPENINLNKVLETMGVMCPESLLRKINSIQIGQFDKLQNRGVDAVFDNKDNLIITNDQDNNYDVLDDIVHEIAHIAEDQYSDKIYGDDKIKYELLNKRKKLRARLEQVGYDTSQYDFLSLKYDEDFDNYLWKKVGYSNLAQIAHDIFLSPYAATSLREYWADAFEDYFMKDRKLVRQYSPAIYDKINELF